MFRHSDCYSQLQNKVSHICEENFAYSSVAAILFNVGRENCGGPISSIFGDIIVYMYAKFGTFITKCMIVSACRPTIDSTTKSKKDLLLFLGVSVYRHGLSLSELDSHKISSYTDFEEVASTLKATNSKPRDWSGGPRRFPLQFSEMLQVPRVLATGLLNAVPVVIVVALDLCVSHVTRVDIRCPTALIGR